MGIDYKRDGAVGVVEMGNAPANAYDWQALRDLRAALVEVRADTGARAVVLRSGLEKFFCAGADIKVLEESDAAGFADFLTAAHDVLEVMESMPKVVIAGIAGHALGGGLEIALGADRRIAAAGKYQMGLVEINLGLNPAMGGTQRLPRTVGRSRAIHMIATGATIGPDEALEWGLIDELHDPGEFEDKVMEYANRIAAGPSHAAGIGKLSVTKGLAMPLAEALVLERAHQNLLFASEDAKEGVAAFLEKRKPDFKGR